MRTDQKHILIVSSEFPPQPGGIGNHAYNLALSLSNEGYMVTVISDQRSKSGDQEKRFDQDLPFDVKRIKRYAFRPLMYLKRLVKTKQFIKRSSTVIATGKFSLWNVGFLSKFYKVRSLAIIHGTEVNFKSTPLRKSVELALKRFDTIIAVSNYTNSLVKHLDLNVKVIPNGINSAEWNPIKATSKRIIGNPVLTTVGRVSIRKGQLNVIRHLPELSKLYPNVHYHCIGIPSLADEFLNEAKALAVDNLVTFHGSLTHEELKHILMQTDVFLMLSSESNDGDIEGFGIAILEANALGIPAIGSVNCGIEDAIKNDETGQLVRPDDVDGFIGAINDILEHKVEYSESARKWAQDHDWSEIIKSYLVLIE